MNTLYWITRFDRISSFFLTMGIIISIVLLFLILAAIITGNSDDSFDKKVFKTSQKNGKILTPICVIVWIIYTLIPTTKEALLIYGVGGTIDYIKENPTANQLPDKCVKALDKWIDSWNIEENDSIKKSN